MAKSYPAIPEWRPLEDLLGLLMQIDNMWAGFRGRIEQQEQEIEALRQVLP